MPCLHEDYQIIMVQDIDTLCGKDENTASKHEQGRSLRGKKKADILKMKCKQIGADIYWQYSLAMSD
jgi:hypothetical protein